MATSNVSIANLALQKLGAASIVALDATPGKAQDINSCFEAIRRAELRKYLWKFAITRAVLAPHGTAPASTAGYAYAFVLPANCLRVIKPARLNIDWHIERHQGQLCILTSDASSLPIRFIEDITDPTAFDPCFVEMFACKLAWQVCERITQSNTKRAAMMEEYQIHRAEARQTNAFEMPTQTQPVDEWITGRSSGQLVNSEWNEE